MLYDKAQLARAYLHAWQVTGDPFFKQAVTEALDFIARGMTYPDGGFDSSLDVDSEDEEGEFYVWSLDEIRATLKDNSDFFEAAYGITSHGIWEGKMVLQRVLDGPSLAAHFKIDIETVPAKLADCHAKLLAIQATRVQPSTDDRVHTSWNGFMLAIMAEKSRTVIVSAAHQSSSHNEEIASLSITLLAITNIIYLLATRNAELTCIPLSST